MAGEFFNKERASVTLESSGASTTDGSCVAASTDLDARAAGNVADDFEAAFELNGAFGSAPSVGKQVDLYLLPKFDGTNLPTFDNTSGAAALPAQFYRGSFTVSKSQTSQRLMVEGIPLSPLLYTAHLVNKTGQTLSSTWTLKAITTRGQYS